MASFLLIFKFFYIFAKQIDNDRVENTPSPIVEVFSDCVTDNQNCTLKRER